MRQSPSQTATVSLPAEMLEQVDEACRALSATRSELVRAALRGFLRQLQRDESLLTRVRATAPNKSEEEIAQEMIASRRARRERKAVAG